MKEKAIQLLNDFTTCYNAELELLPIKEFSDLDNVKYIIFDTPLAVDKIFSKLGHAYSYSDCGTIFVRITNHTWGSLEYDISSLKKRLEKLQDTQTTLLAKYAIKPKKYNYEELLSTCAYWFDDKLKITDNLSKCRFICFKSQAYKDKFFKEYARFIIIENDETPDLIYEIFNMNSNTKQWRSVNFTTLKLDEQKQKYKEISKKIINYKNEKEN